MSLFNIIWIYLILTTLIPIIRQKQVEMVRIARMRRIQDERQARIITLIHRQESMSFLGMFQHRYITIEDSEHVLRAIRLTPDDMPIDLILHTPGGLVLASEQIARALLHHPAKVTVFVPHYAMSGGTMIALAADEIWMDENAVLGPVDPQIGSFPAASILAVTEMKSRDRIDDETLILADIAAKAMRQVRKVVVEILNDKLGEQAKLVGQVLTEGRWTHDYPITCEILSNLGLPIRCGLPRRIYELMELYPQPGQRRPSVQYVPMPTRRDGDSRK